MRCTAERRDHRYSEGALPVRREWHAVGPHEHGLAEHSGGCHPCARPDRLCARASLVTVVGKPCNCRLTSLVTVVLQDTPPQVTDCAGDSRLNLPQILLLLPQAVRASFVSSVKTRHVSWSSLSGQASEQGVCVQKVAGSANGSNWPSRSKGQRVCSCVTLSRQDQPFLRRDEEVLDARGGHHLGVGAAQEEEGWRRRGTT